MMFVFIYLILFGIVFNYSYLYCSRTDSSNNLKWRDNLIFTLKKTSLHSNQPIKQDINFISYILSKNFIIDECFVISITLNKLDYNLLLDTGSHISWIRNNDKFSSNKSLDISYAVGNIKGNISKNNQQGFLYKLKYLSKVKTDIKAVKKLDGVLAVGLNKYRLGDNHFNPFSLIEVLKRNKFIKHGIFLIDKDTLRPNFFSLKFLSNHFDRRDYIFFNIPKSHHNLSWRIKITELIIKESDFKYNSYDRSNLLVDTGSSHISAPFKLCQEFKLILLNRSSDCDFFKLDNEGICGFTCQKTSGIKHFDIEFKSGIKSFKLNTIKLFKFLPTYNLFLFQIIFANTANEWVLGMPFFDQFNIIFDYDNKLVGLKSNL